MSNKKILLPRTNKGDVRVPSGASVGELFMNYSSGNQAHLVFKKEKDDLAVIREQAWNDEHYASKADFENVLTVDENNVLNKKDLKVGGLEIVTGEYNFILHIPYWHHSNTDVSFTNGIAEATGNYMPFEDGYYDEDCDDEYCWVSFPDYTRMGMEFRLISVEEYETEDPVGTLFYTMAKGREIDGKIYVNDCTSVWGNYEDWSDVVEGEPYLTKELITTYGVDFTNLYLNGEEVALKSSVPSLKRVVLKNENDVVETLNVGNLQINNNVETYEEGEDDVSRKFILEANSGLSVSFDTHYENTSYEDNVSFTLSNGRIDASVSVTSDDDYESQHSDISLRNDTVKLGSSNGSGEESSIEIFSNKIGLNTPSATLNGARIATTNDIPKNVIKEITINNTVKTGTSVNLGTVVTGVKVNGSTKTGATPDLGTVVTGVKVNGVTKTGSTPDLGTFLTSHQDISGKADKADFEALSGALIDVEYVTSVAINRMNESAGFTEDGNSKLPSGQTLTAAIQELINRPTTPENVLTADENNVLDRKNLKVGGLEIVTGEYTYKLHIPHWCHNNTGEEFFNGVAEATGNYEPFEDGYYDEECNDGEGCWTSFPDYTRMGMEFRLVSVESYNEEYGTPVGTLFYTMAKGREIDGKTYVDDCTSVWGNYDDWSDVVEGEPYLTKELITTYGVEHTNLYLNGEEVALKSSVPSLSKAVLKDENGIVDALKVKNIQTSGLSVDIYKLHPDADDDGYYNNTTLNINDNINAKVSLTNYEYSILTEIELTKENAILSSRENLGDGDENISEIKVGYGSGIELNAETVTINGKVIATTDQIPKNVIKEITINNVVKTGTSVNLGTFTTGVKINGTTKTGATPDLGTFTTGVKINGSTKTGATPDLGTVVTGVKVNGTTKTGATPDLGTVVTGVTMNGVKKTGSTVDLGTVLTAHQDISGKADKADFEALSGALIDVEYVIAVAINKINEAAGFDENCNSTLDDGQTLTDAIRDLKDNPTFNSGISIAGNVTGNIGFDENDTLTISCDEGVKLTGDGSNTYTFAQDNIFLTEADGAVKEVIPRLKNNSSETRYLIGSTLYDNETRLVDTELFVSPAIYTNGVNIFAMSDETLKNFKDDIKCDFEALKTIPKKTFTWKDREENGVDIGTSAQKLQKVYPELVTIDPDGRLGVAYDKLSIVSLAYVDKLYDMYKELEGKYNELKKELDELKK